MSKTTDFIINNPGKNFDGSDYVEPINEPAYLSLSNWQGMTKAEVTTQAQSLVEMILTAGGADKAAERLANMEAFIKSVKADERFTEEVRAEIARHGGRLQTVSGAKLELMEGGTIWHYENTGDATLIELQAQAKAAAEAVKKREEFLKALPEDGLPMVDMESSESYTLYPPYKTSKSTYKVTLSK